jgi:hypothetical protein
MQIPAGNNHTVEIVTPHGMGSGQIVRAYRKFFVFRRRVSSDWFLNREQAERFARKLAAEIASEESGTPKQ